MKQYKIFPIGRETSASGGYGIFIEGSTIFDSTLRHLEDSNGNNSILSLSTAQVGIAGSVQYDWVSTPTGVANKTTMWFDATGRMNWRPGTGASSFIRTFDATGITADRVYTLPNATTTIAGLAVAQTFTANQTVTGTTQFSALSVSGVTGGGLSIGSYDATYGGFWSRNVTPSISNYALISNGADTALNATGQLSFYRNNSILGQWNSTGLGVGGSFTISAKCHVRGDGVNPIFRGETSAGVTVVLISSISGSALFTLTSTTQGFLPPRMTTAQKNAIGSPANGLVVFDTTLNKLCVFTTVWETIRSV